MRGKSSRLLVLILIAFGLPSLTTQAFCRKTPKQTTNCTLKNGRPCPKWLNTIIGPYPLERDQEAASISYWTRRGVKALHRHLRHQQSRNP